MRKLGKTDLPAKVRSNSHFAANLPGISW